MSSLPLVAGTAPPKIGSAAQLGIFYANFQEIEGVQRLLGKKLATSNNKYLWKRENKIETFQGSLHKKIAISMSSIQ